MAVRNLQHEAVLSWVDASEDSRWVAALYRETASRGVAAFRRWALDHLARQVPHAAAVWCTRRLGEDRITAIGVRGLAAAALEPLLIHGSSAWMVSAGRPHADRSALRCEDFAALAHHSAPAAALRRHGFAHGVVCVTAHADSLYASAVCVLHDNALDAQLPALAVRLPHLAQAESLALESRLQLDHRLAASGRRNRGVSCLADDQGYVRCAAPGFRALLHRHVAGWDGLRLPFDLRNAKTARQQAAQHGLHVRVTGASQSWHQVHVRVAHPFDVLTDREHDVVKAMVDGESYKAVARRLGVSASTVANHASNIYRKLGAYSREEVVTLAASFAFAADKVQEADAD